MNKLIYLDRVLSRKQMHFSSICVFALSSVFIIVICYAEIGHSFGWEFADALHANLHNSHRWIRLTW